jgi:hypothetical protein
MKERVKEFISDTPSPLRGVPYLIRSGSEVAIEREVFQGTTCIKWK